MALLCKLSGVLCRPHVLAWAAYDRAICPQYTPYQPVRIWQSVKSVDLKNSLYLTWLISKTLELRPMWLNMHIWAVLIRHTFILCLVIKVHTILLVLYCLSPGHSTDASPLLNIVVTHLFSISATQPQCPYIKSVHSEKVLEVWWSWWSWESS